MRIFVQMASTTEIGFLKAFLWQQASIYNIHNQRDQQTEMHESCLAILQKTEDVLAPAWAISKDQAVRSYVFILCSIYSLKSRYRVLFVVLLVIV